MNKKIINKRNEYYENKNYEINHNKIFDYERLKKNKKCNKCNKNNNFLNFHSCKKCLFEEFVNEGIAQYIFSLQSQTKLNLNKISIEGQSIEINYFLHMTAFFYNKKKFELYIKSKICAGCYEQITYTKNILSFQCGCHYCLSCQNIIYGKKRKLKCLKCNQ
jgi:hypothetical protein